MKSGDRVCLTDEAREEETAIWKRLGRSVGTLMYPGGLASCWVIHWSNGEQCMVNEYWLQRVDPPKQEAR